jgi:hypothetical protein
MIAFIVSLAVSLIGAALFVMLCHRYWTEALGLEEPGGERRFMAWVGRGLCVPVVAWLILNVGISDHLPPVTPAAYRAWTDPAWSPWDGLRVAMPATLVFASVWAAVTMGWLFVGLWPHARDRRELIGVSLFWGVFLAPVVWITLWITGSLGLGLAMLIWLIAWVHFALPLAVMKPAAPSYSPAVARMKFGRYAEAESELLKGLEQREDDFEGWMMLAELYARHFHELDQADGLIRDVCRQPNVNELQISLALNRLADWHLQLGTDPVAARGALGLLVDLLPGTHSERMARRRIEQLPESRSELEEQRRPRSIRLPALGDRLDAPGDEIASEPVTTDAADRANRCVEKLRHNPDNVEARESLALILAEELGQAEAGIGQLELLLGMREVPEGKSAEWLSLMAAWHLKKRRDQPAAEVVLERIVREYPKTVHAMAARRRLELLETERRYSAFRRSSI